MKPLPFFQQLWTVNVRPIKRKQYKKPSIVTESLTQNVFHYRLQSYPSPANCNVHFEASILNHYKYHYQHFHGRERGNIRRSRGGDRASLHFSQSPGPLGRGVEIFRFTSKKHVGRSKASPPLPHLSEDLDPPLGCEEHQTISNKKINKPFIRQSIFRPLLFLASTVGGLYPFKCLE